MYAIKLELEFDEDTGVYTVTSPDVPGLVTEGKTPEEISHNVQEALDGLLQVWRDLNMPIPTALLQARAQLPKVADLLVAA